MRGGHLKQLYFYRCMNYTDGTYTGGEGKGREKEREKKEKENFQKKNNYLLRDVKCTLYHEGAMVPSCRF